MNTFTLSYWPRTLTKLFKRWNTTKYHAQPQMSEWFLHLFLHDVIFLWRKFFVFYSFLFFFVIGYKEIADKSHNKEYNWFSFLFFVILLFESSNWWDNRAAQYCIFIYAFHLLFCCLPIEHVFPWNYWQSHKKILLYLFKAQDTFVSWKEVCFVCVPVEKRYHLKLLIK